MPAMTRTTPEAAARIAADRRPVRRLEDVLSELNGGVMIDPHRQIHRVETETKEPPMRPFPERPNRSGLDD